MKREKLSDKLEQAFFYEGLNDPHNDSYVVGIRRLEKRLKTAQDKLKEIKGYVEKIKEEGLKRYDDEPVDYRLSFVYEDYPYLYEIEDLVK